jgi:hypothetical protein
MYCHRCGEKRMCRMIAGTIQIRSQVRGSEAILHQPSYHDLLQMTYILTSIIVDSAGDEIERVIHAVRTMADAGPRWEGR